MSEDRKLKSIAKEFMSWCKSFQSEIVHKNKMDDLVHKTLVFAAIKLRHICESRGVNLDE